MRQEQIDKLTKVLFWINVLYLISNVFLIVFALIYINSEKFDLFFTLRDKFWFQVINVIVTIALISFWIYNIRFCYKFDRYSNNFIPLIFFGFLISPFYYFNVNIRRRKLCNETKVVKEPVLGQSIILQDYDDDTEIEKDIKNLK